MIILPQVLIEIVAAGGGLIINLNNQMLMPETMIQIAAVAASSGASVTFKLGGTVLLPQIMLRVAAAGRGRVIFDLS